MRRLPFFMIALSIALATACSSGGTQSEGGASGQSRRSDLITREELAPISQFSAFDAVRRLRPRWLSSRGGGRLPTVFVDGSARGEPSFLRQISADTVERMRFMSAPDATMRYGTGYAFGIIEVISRRGN